MRHRLHPASVDELANRLALLGQTHVMLRRPIPFWMALGAFQIVRFGVLSWFLNSDWNTWVGTFIVAAAMLDFLVLSKIVGATGVKSTNTEAFVPTLGKRDPTSAAFVGMVICFLATTFCVCIPMVGLYGWLPPAGPTVGPVPLTDALQHPEAGTIKFSDGHPRTEEIGSVRYKFGRSSPQYFYAMPFVADDWTAAQPVTVWAVVNQSDFEKPAMRGWNAGVLVTQRDIQRHVYESAVANAEKNFGFESAPGALTILLRAEAPAPAAYPLLWNENFWFAVVYVSTWLFTWPYCSRLFAPIPVEDMGNDPVPVPVRAGEAVIPQSDSSFILPPSSFLFRRWFWFLAHPGLFGISAILMFSVAHIGWLIPYVFLLPILELWVLIRTFRPVKKTSRFVWLALLFSLSLFFSLILMAVFGGRLSEWRTMSQTAVPLDVRTGSSDTEAAYFEFTGTPTLKTELDGIYFAPSEESDNWWLVPVVSEDWKPADPIRVWAESIDRTCEQDWNRPLHFAKRQSPTLRTRGALVDALQRHQLASAPDAVFVRLAADWKTREEEAGGMVVIGIAACLLAWAISACFWPRLSDAQV